MYRHVISDSSVFTKEISLVIRGAREILGTPTVNYEIQMLANFRENVIHLLENLAKSVILSSLYCLPTYMKMAWNPNFTIFRNSSVVSTKRL